MQLHWSAVSGSQYNKDLWISVSCMVKGKCVIQLKLSSVQLAFKDIVGSTFFFSVYVFISETV